MHSKAGQTKFSFQLHNGISSILLILIILSLVSFSILSIASANADYKLTQKLQTRTTAYYEACNTAEAQLASIDQTLQSIYRKTSSSDAFYAQAGKGTSFYISISDIQKLSIEITYNYPMQADSSFYTITRWQVETDTDNMIYNETLPLPE